MLIGELVVPQWAQGRSGRGQGGYTASRFADLIEQGDRVIEEDGCVDAGFPADTTISVALRAPIPLDVALEARSAADGWELRDGNDVIMTATRTARNYAPTPPITVGDAAAARARFTGHAEHPAPNCVSCGTGDRTMRVWSDKLNDGTNRVATDWCPPSWAAGANGEVESHFVWMALDCTSGFFVAGADDERDAVTVQFAAEIVRPVRANQTYAVVGFDGNWEGSWNGRKRGAGAAVFDEAGELVAQADSFWLTVE